VNPHLSTAPNLKKVTIDESGVPTLLGTSHTPLELRQRDVLLLSQKFASLISLCSTAEVIHTPFLGKHPYHIQYLRFASGRSSLRHLVLTGIEALDMFVKDVLIEGRGSQTFPNLESFSLFEFNSNSPHLKHMLKQINDDNGRGLLPDLHTLHLQDGVLASDFLPRFLQALGARPTTLILLNLHDLSASVECVPQEALQHITNSILDIPTLAWFGVSRETHGETGFSLSNLTALNTLEIRLLTIDSKYTSKAWHPNQPYLFGDFPKLLGPLPSSLQVLTMVAYCPLNGALDSDDLVERREVVVPQKKLEPEVATPKDWELRQVIFLERCV